MSSLMRCAVAVALAAIGGGNAACESSPEPAFLPRHALRIATGEPGSIFHATVEGMADELERRIAGIDATVVTSPGAQRNVEAVEQGNADAAFTMSDVAYEASTRGLDSPPFTRLRGIAVVYATTLHLVVGPRSIQTLGDLRGRRVGIGTPGSGSVFTARLVLGGLGARTAHTEPVPFNLAPQRVLDGTLDALMINSNFPTRSVDTALRGGARLLSIEGPDVDRLRQKSPFLGPIAIPAGTYTGQAAAVHTIGVDNILVCRSELDEQLVYDFTKAFFDLLPAAAAAQPSLRLVTPTRASATPIPLHPGAARYYRERELLR